LVEVQGRTVVVVTHDAAIARKAHLRLRMADGKLLGQGSAEAAAAIAEEEEDAEPEEEEAHQRDPTMDDLIGGGRSSS
ncbi:MAG: hypothetical protein HW388_1640, partial [Dehalococcoidia bacterium]|nr:hypothetical protein [Dehalococcoidia bacterium]